MKARLLQKLLNTERVCSNHKDYIAVGSAYVHDLFSVNKNTLELKYALDTFREGRSVLLEKDSTELLEIYDKLQGLIDSGAMLNIIHDDDEIENQIPIFTVSEGNLISTFTDKFKFPNVTISGEQMYTNTHFKTKKEAIEYGVSECESYCKIFSEQIEQKEKELKERQEKLDFYTEKMNELKNQL